PPPLTETLALVFEIALILFVQKCNAYADESGSCKLRRELFQVLSAVSRLIQKRQVLAHMSDKNKIRELLCPAGPENSVSVYRRMLNVFRRRKPFEIIQLFFHPSLRVCQQFLFVARNTLR